MRELLTNSPTLMIAMLWAGELLKLKLLIDSDADIDAPSEYYSPAWLDPGDGINDERGSG